MRSLEAPEARVLVYAPIGRDGPASANVLRRAGLDVEVCWNIEEVLAQADLGVSTLCVTEEALFGKNLVAMAAWIDRQPAWSDVPFVVLTSHLRQPAVEVWRQKMLASLRNVSLLERPVHSITLSSTVRAAVRARGR